MEGYCKLLLMASTSEPRKTNNVYEALILPSTNKILGRFRSLVYVVPNLDRKLTPIFSLVKIGAAKKFCKIQSNKSLYL